MKRIYFKLILISLVLLFLFSILGFVGTSISQKYWIDDPYFGTISNVEILRVKLLQETLNRDFNICIILGVTSFISLFALIYKKDSIVIKTE